MARVQPAVPTGAYTSLLCQSRAPWGLTNSWFRCSRPGGGSIGQTKAAVSVFPPQVVTEEAVTFSWGLLGISEVSWLEGAGSQHSSSKEGRERAWG